MLIVKRVSLEKFEPKTVEQAIRGFSKRKGYNIHLDSSITDLPTKMLFHGIEDQKRILLIRIKTQLELVLPKLIIEFKKEENFTRYSISFGIFPLIAFTIMSLVFLTHTAIVITGGESLDEYVGVFICMLVCVTACYIEIYLVERRVKKAIAEFLSNEIPG